MLEAKGKTVCGGIAAGTVYVLRRKEAALQKKSAASAEEEERRLKQALDTVGRDLDACMASAEQNGQREARDIFEIHRMMLDDEDITAMLWDTVRQGGTAESAVRQTEQVFSQALLDTGDEYMIARIDDIRDLCGRLTDRLSQNGTSDFPQEPFILVADELFPSDLSICDRALLSGIAVRSGAAHSHAMILARAMGIPTLTGADISAAKAGTRAVIDGDRGVIVFEPDAQTEAAIRQNAKTDPPAVLFDGRPPIPLFVNIESAQAADADLLKKCDGIGLFRTEFLFIGRTRPPDEEEQFETYKSVLLAAESKPVIIRTFDLGADKQSPALPLETEQNPALGCRGLRVYSLYPSVFRTQLRALLRAAVYGDLRIMYPMVTSCEEIGEMRRQVEEAAGELTAQSIPFRIPPQGAMIETPAAVMMSAELAKAVDFFSVGTNDLAQYTYALDRQDGKADRFAPQNDTALLRLIALAAENAHKAGIEIGICGEIASDLSLTEEWIKMAIDEISVSPAVLRTVYPV